MSQKQEKKLRKMFREEIKDKIDDLTTQNFKHGEVYKNKPKWCPAWLWSKIVHLVIDDNFYIKYENWRKQQIDSDNTQ